MGFDLVAFERIKTGIILSIDYLLELEGLSTAYRKSSIDKLSNEVRRSQCQFLFQVLELVNRESIDDDQKARLLNAAACYVRDQIIKSYANSLPLFKPNGSNLYNCLTQSLNITEANDFNFADKAALYNELRKFLSKHLYIESDLSKGYQVDHPFNEKNCPGYSPAADMKILCQDIATFTNEVINQADKLYGQQQHLYTSINTHSYAQLATTAYSNAYKELVTKIYGVLDALLLKHKLDPTKRGESLKGIDNKQRREHALFLNQMIASLAQIDMPDIERIRVLKGASCFVYDQIPSSSWGAGSTLKVNLAVALGISSVNDFSAAERATYYNSLRKFVFARVFVEGEPSKGFQMNHAFSDAHIKDYHVATDLKTICNEVARYSVILIDQMEDDIKKIKRTNNGLGFYQNKSVDFEGPRLSSSPK